MPSIKLAYRMCHLRVGALRCICNCKMREAQKMAQILGPIYTTELLILSLTRLWVNPSNSFQHKSTN